MAINKKALRRAAKIALARKNLWEYAKLVAPGWFNDKHPYLKDWLDEYQKWYFAPEEERKKYFIFNGPPRFGKSACLQILASFLIGHNPKLRIFVITYKDDLTEEFSNYIKNIIEAKHEDENDDRILFCDIFPDVKMQMGRNKINKWSVNKATGTTFLACTVNSLATGYGSDLVLIDDVVKGADESFNEELLKKRFREINNTCLLSRIEKGGRVVCASTRWSVYDVSGQIEKTYGHDAVVKIVKAQNEDGTMLCEDVLPLKEFEEKKKGADKNIFLANYQQELIDEEGKLYEKFKIWTPDMLPQMDEKGRKYVYKSECIIDVADRGSDFYCSIFYYPLRDGRIFIKDILYTDKPLREIQNLQIDAIKNNDCILCIGEGNNGGSIYIDNLRKEFTQKYGNTCVFRFFNQSQNKETRIITQAPWVNEYIYMPAGWEYNYIDFNIALTRFQRIFKDNKHDDAADAITMISDRFNKTNNKAPKIYR